MVRLAPPGHGRIEFAKVLEVDVGGGEFNVAYACARLGLRTGFISKLPDNPVARIILNHARAVGMDVSNVLMEKFDGVGRKGARRAEFHRSRHRRAGQRDDVRSRPFLHFPNETGGNGLDEDFRSEGRGLAAHRRHSGRAFRQQRGGDQGGLASGARGRNGHQLRPQFPQQTLEQREGHRRDQDIIPHVQVLIGNEEDFQKVLGFEVEGTTAICANCRWRPTNAWCCAWSKPFPTSRPSAPPCARSRAALSIIGAASSGTTASSLRRGHSRTLEIEDRVGGGDGFSSGIAYGFIKGMPPGEIVNFGAAHGALLQTTRGRHLASFAGGSHARDERRLGAHPKVGDDSLLIVAGWRLRRQATCMPAMRGHLDGPATG
jgi:2-dehydro-3-deoxygluconokinase